MCSTEGIYAPLLCASLLAVEPFAFPVHRIEYSFLPYLEAEIIVGQADRQTEDTLGGVRESEL